MKYSLRSLMIVALVGPPMVALVIYGVALVVPREFAAASWKNDRNVRATMIDDLIASQSLPGKRATDVEEMLGDPDDERGEHWYCRIRSNGIDDMWLELNFKNGRVASVKYRSD